MSLNSQNTALRTALAQAFATAFEGGTLAIKTSGGTLLGSITMGFAAASAGSVAKTGTWSDGAADNSGVARIGLLTSADSTKTCQITIGLTGSGADAIIDDENVVAGGIITINTFVYTVPVS